MFDVVVIGGGHAGVEAAHISQSFGLKVALITLPGVGIGSAPCNPSVGGVGKGQVVREIDALGGLMGILADKAGIQYRTLNDSKGYAVQSTRVQIDKDLYSQFATEELEKTTLTILRGKVQNVGRENDLFLITLQDSSVVAKKVIVTVGTFLGGKLHTGSEQNTGGRHEQEASSGLMDIFTDIKTVPARFKTGTPPRLLVSSVDFNKMEVQPSDASTRNFHCMSDRFFRPRKQMNCYLTRTTEDTLAIIRENKARSPMYNGQIQGVGARYCPSIEDKAYRYPDKNTHHIFIEPEGENLDTLYPSGISSSLPKDVQESFVRTIPGLENAEIKVYGYAVEYDVVDTTELSLALEYKNIPGLYFAGQVNGTSGYEEAAGQGLIAGINASFALLGRETFILSRHDTYIGVMIEDLCTNTRDEPYRLFTARAENRLYLREDNTVLRIKPYRELLGLHSELDKFLKNYFFAYESLFFLCDSYMVGENSELALMIKEFSGQDVVRRMSVSEVLKMATLDPVAVLTKILSYADIIFDLDVVKAVAIEKKYSGYVSKSEDQQEKIKKLDTTRIDWEEVCRSNNVSFECRQRISKIRPQTFGQLKLIEGIRPATLAVVASRAL